MHEQIENVMTLLKKKETLFSEYENLSMLMLDDDINNLDRHIEQRNTLASKIDELEMEINSTLHQNEQIIHAIKNDCARADLPDTLKPVFDLSQNIFSIIYRIGKINSDIQQKITAQQNDILTQIKNLNSGNQAFASKFMPPSDGSTPYFPDKIKNI